MLSGGGLETQLFVKYLELLKRGSRFAGCKGEACLADGNNPHDIARRRTSGNTSSSALGFVLEQRWDSDGEARAAARGIAGRDLPTVRRDDLLGDG